MLAESARMTTSDEADEHCVEEYRNRLAIV